METQTISSESVSMEIPPVHREAATRYISALARRDPLAMLGEAYVRSRSQELWEAFAASYARLATGPYARHGADLIRIALTRL